MATTETQDAVRKAAQVGGVDEAAADLIAAELEKAGYQVTKAPAPTKLVAGEAAPATPPAA